MKCYDEFVLRFCIICVVDFDFLGVVFKVKYFVVILFLVGLYCWWVIENRDNDCLFFFEFEVKINFYSFNCKRLNNFYGVKRKFEKFKKVFREVFKEVVREEMSFDDDFLSEFLLVSFVIVK